MTIQSEQQLFAQAVRDNIRDEINSRFREVVTGKLNTDDTVTLADTTLNPNQMYVRPSYYSLSAFVVWGRVSRSNIDVIVERIGTEWQYKCPNYRKAGVAVGAALATAVSPPLVGTALPVLLPGEKLRPGIVRKSDAGGLYVYLEPHFYLRHGVYTYFAGEDIDLSGSLPGAGLQRWVLVCIDPDTGAAALLNGSTLSTSLTLTRSSIASIAIGDYLPRCAVRVYNGQTTVLEQETDIADARLWLDGQIPTYKNYLDATTAPTTGDDSADGYTVGSIWINTSSGTIYMCEDASAGAAAWVSLGSTGVAPEFNDRELVSATVLGSGNITLPGYAGHGDEAGLNGGGIDEEYDSSTTGLTWSPSDPSTVDADTTRASHLYVESNDSTERLGTRAFSPAGDFTAYTKIVLACDGSTNINAVGIHIGDSGNSNRLLLEVNRSGATWTVNAYTYASSAYTSRGSRTVYPIPVLYLKVTRATNDISYWFSSDGYTWNLIVTYTFSLTVTNIGYRIWSNTGATAYRFTSDFLRTNV